MIFCKHHNQEGSDHNNIRDCRMLCNNSVSQELIIIEDSIEPPLILVGNLSEES